ncbi:hypothetical protein H4S06_002684 [Coemansia sp. BCRC 34490]|nr:hypothetical protein H4S06_002684 [Coemansia sp. BCRC 34490]
MLYILDTWFPSIYIWLALKPTCISFADRIRVLDDKNRHLELVLVTFTATIFDNPLYPCSFQDNQNALADSPDIQLNMLQIVTFRHYRFVYYPGSNRYEQIGQWKDPDWYNEDRSQKEGLSRAKVEGRHLLFGPCLIDVQEKSYLRLFYDEVVNPFYIFQIASVAVWCYEEYYYYACAILVISAVSIIVNLVAAKSTMRKMRKMAMHTCPVTVLRNGDWLQVASECLVPGDIIDLGSSKLSTLPCDAVVLEGDCIVNESMLTGESVPEFKYPLEKRSEFFSKIDMAACTFKPFISRHMVFAGTRLVRVRRTESAYGCMAAETPQENMRATAMVLRTAFCSTKGGLVRSILFPRPTKFQFYRDAFRFVGILAVVAVIGFAVNTVNLHSLGVSASTIAIKALDLITVVVPPALPASMSIGMAFAARRLSKKGIFCISPSRINVASKVAVICFDKTGTLTEEGLDLLGMRVSDRSRCQFLPLCSEVSGLVGSTSKAQNEKITTCADVAGINILEAIASCHSLQLVDNQLVGDPLEIKMFEFSGWKMYENENTRATVVCPPMFASYANGFSQTNVKEEASSCYLADQGGDSSYKERPCAVEIIKSFNFASELRRASVVVQKQSTKQHAEAYVKGAPEVIKDICLPETVPSEYAAILDDYTQKGFRVIAIAGKSINNWSLLSENGMIPQRTEAESALTFMGLLVFENRLKPKTTTTLGELRQAKIRTVMCTGDNPFTAVSVARECRLVQPNVTVFVSHLTAAPVETNDAIKEVLESEKSDLSARCSSSLRSFSDIVWRESTGKAVHLDPLDLAPKAIDQADKQTVALAKSLADSGKYCLAVTGDAFEICKSSALAFPDTWRHMLMRGTVYARMYPEQKAVLVDQLQELGYIAGFCGDGANDCAALKTADVGISLSEAEASVAAPFTSRVSDISCVADVLKEGRCSIATSFGCFKYMMLYSMIQFTTCCLLYIYNTNLTNGQFLYVDLFIIIPIAVCMNRAKPFKKLVPKRPSASLISKRVLTSLVGNIALIIGFQVAIYFMTEAQSWYKKPVPKKADDPDSTPLEGHLNTSIFLFSTFQYIFTGLIFSIGPPYRQPISQNRLYLATLVILLAFDLWMVLVPVKGFYSLFGLVHVSVGWRFVILGMGVANFTLCYCGEQYLFPWVAPRAAKVVRFLRLVWNRYLQREYVGDRTNTSKCLENGVVTRNVTTGGIWQRAGKRENRKSYKLVLEKMPGKAEWY